MTHTRSHLGLLAVVALAAACSCNQGTGPVLAEGTRGEASDGAASGGETTEIDLLDAARSPEPDLARPLTVGVHSRVQGFDQQAVSEKLERMNRVLEANGPVAIEECTGHANDIDVGVDFTLSSFATFPDGDGQIDTEEEYLEVARLPYDIKIVESIAWCSCTSTEHPEILGCAEQKKAVVVALPDHGVEPIVWAHEYGHFAGLRHSTDTDSVMYDYAGRCKVVVSEEQRRLYREPTRDAAPAQTCSWSALPIMQPEASDGALEDQIRRFVTATHVHGLSYAQAREFGKRAHTLDYLLGLLEDPEFRAHHDQIALVLGAIGGERAIERLMALVAESKLDAEALPALRSALPALGWALSSAPPEAGAQIDEVLDFLAERTKVGSWKEAVASLSQGERDALAADLATRAAMGLAFAGKNVRDRFKQAFAGAEQDELQAVFEHMQRVNQAIQKSPGGSLTAYYAGQR